MSRYRTAIVAAAVCSLLASCFKDEPLNAECDIEQAWLHFADPAEATWNVTDTMVNVISSTDAINFRVRPGTDRTALAPQFAMTPGASITPASGTPHDFTQGPAVYTVTSEDGQWQRVYTVRVDEERHTVSDTLKLDFEHFEMYNVPNSSAKYYNWYMVNADGERVNWWTTANGGFKISNFTAKPEEYPTVPCADGHDGYCVQLVTRSTGMIAVNAGKPMAAGNLFFGTFDPTNALADALHATRMGVPFDKRPVKFSGWYKFTPGDVFKNQKGAVVEGKVDRGTIYCIVYRNHDAAGNAITLYGDNIQTSDMIVSKAVVPNVDETNGQWQYFEIPFVPFGQKEIDPALLNTFGYNLAVVCSSSENGAYFEGAPDDPKKGIKGSTLYVDQLRVICETDQ